MKSRHSIRRFSIGAWTISIVLLLPIFAYAAYNAGSILLTKGSIKFTERSSAPTTPDAKASGAAVLYMDSGNHKLKLSNDNAAYATILTDAAASVPDSALSSNVALLNRDPQTWTGKQTWNRPAATETEQLFSGTTTSAHYIRIQNTSGDLVLCLDSSVGARCVGGSAAYSGALINIADKPFYLGQNNTTRMTIDNDSVTLATGTKLVTTNSIQGAKQKTLTESSATSFVRVDIASGSVVGGVIEYTIEANDSTDFQSRSGIIPFTAVNKAGTETGTLGTVGAATEVVAVSTGTLTNTFTIDTTPTNGINIQSNAVSSLTQTTLRINYRVTISSGTATVNPL
jgi:hypothetical protein